jgi:glycosyltransferase involved in cell wall biosynthesis
MRLGSIFSRRPPVRVAVDLTRFGSGGQNGGVKIQTFRFLRWIAEERGRDFAFIYFTKSSLVPEVEEFRRECDFQVCLGESEGCAMPASAKAGLVASPGDPGEWTLRWPADVLYAPLGFSLMCRPGLPWVSHIVDTLHRDHPELLPPAEVAFREKWYRDSLARADAVQCISEFAKGQVERYYAPAAGKVFITYVAVQDRVLGIAQKEAAAGGRLGEASLPRLPRPYFFYPANDWPHKNHGRLLEAYAAYRRSAGERAWDLVLSGYFAREREIKDVIGKLGIEGACHILGHLETVDQVAVFRGAGALVFPSLYEGFGIPILEAMALGVPIACSRAGSLPEVAGKAALYFVPEDPGAITEAMGRISSDEALRKELVRLGHRRASDFSLRREAGRLADRLAALARTERAE